MFLWSCTLAELGERLEMTFSNAFDLQAGQCGLENSSDLSGKVVIVRKEEVGRETDPP